MKRSTFLLVRRNLRVFSTTPAETPKEPKNNAGATNLKSSGTHKVNNLERKVSYFQTLEFYSLLNQNFESLLLDVSLGKLRRCFQSSF